MRCHVDQIVHVAVFRAGYTQDDFVPIVRPGHQFNIVGVGKGGRCAAPYRFRARRKERVVCPFRQSRPADDAAVGMVEKEIVEFQKRFRRRCGAAVLQGHLLDFAVTIVARLHQNARSVCGQPVHIRRLDRSGNIENLVQRPVDLHPQDPVLRVLIVVRLGDDFALRIDDPIRVGRAALDEPRAPCVQIDFEQGAPAFARRKIDAFHEGEDGAVDIANPRHSGDDIHGLNIVIVVLHQRDRVMRVHVEDLRHRPFLPRPDQADARGSR